MDKSYEKMKGGYYHDVLTSGNPIQRYWHKYRFKQVMDWINPKNKTILDIGCGPGDLLSKIPKTYKKATGIDFDKKQIDFAKKQFKDNKKLSWKVGDVAKLPKTQKFDIIICSEVIEHVTKKDSYKLLQSAKSLLNKGGTLILTTPNYRSFWPAIEILVNAMGEVDYNEQHINKLHRSSLIKDIKKNGLKVKRIKSFYISAPFLSPLSERMARKIQRFEEKIFPRLGSILIVEIKNE